MSVNATPAGAQAAAESESEKPAGRHAAVPEQRSRRGSRTPLSENKRAERRLGWLLCAPAALVMVLVTAYPILYSVWLSLQRFDLRFPDERQFVGLENYVTVLTNDFWWTAFGVTALITVVTVAVELVLGMGLALIMHRTLVGRGIVRTAALIPYGIVTVVAAFSWRYAWTPGTGYLANLFDGSAPLTERASSLAIIMLAEIWKTTPFMALLLMAGLALVPEDLLKAASTDGATAWQRFTKVMLPVMKPAILVALLFRTLDAFRVFDNIFVLTNGGNETSSVSMLAYNNLIRGLNLGIGSTMSVLIFITVAIIAFVFVKLFGTAAPGSDDGERR
ncbi:carbohydrate ABC transporter permease [Micromonospora chalcea]|uniref:carbohydrate ABC transporter permease n=1 Tax=Micromonospora chalcea TaxID=1874 RepID=UPI0004C347B0|nr:sugar ABC transporter permease [Micromonospora purpureochromogenes]